MKTKILSFALATLSILIFANCGGNDDEESNGGNANNGGTEITTDYTATSKVKTITLTPMYEEKFDKGIYEDFNRFYTLEYSNGNLCLVPYFRENGKWQCKVKINYYYYGCLLGSFDEGNGIGIKDIGKVNGLASVSEKCVPFSGNFPQLQPYHGYAASFTTEDGDVKYLRAYCTGVKKYDEGKLSEVYIQYQLY